MHAGLKQFLMLLQIVVQLAPPSPQRRVSSSLENRYLTHPNRVVVSPANLQRYPPFGERCWGPFYAPPRWGLSMREYLDRADAEVLAIGTIEHIDAIKSISEIVSTPGLDLVFIGPGDLATSMGLKGETEHPEVLAAITALEESIRDSPVILGGVATTPDRANEMIAPGARPPREPGEVQANVLTLSRNLLACYVDPRMPIPLPSQKPHIARSGLASQRICDHWPPPRWAASDRTCATRPLPLHKSSLA
jgi:hypothetical protein